MAVGEIKYMSDGNNYKAWTMDGKYHNDNDEPALICYNGETIWWRHGKIHRETGPAIICVNGQENRKEWWLNDEQYSFSIWYEMVKSSLSQAEKVEIKLTYG